MYERSLRFTSWVYGNTKAWSRTKSSSLSKIWHEKLILSPTHLGGKTSVGDSSGLTSTGSSLTFLCCCGLCGSSFCSILPRVAAKVLATAELGWPGAWAPELAIEETSASPSSSSLPPSPFPILLCRATWVCRSISRMSSIVSPTHSSCQAQAWRWARSIVFLNAAKKKKEMQNSFFSLSSFAVAPNSEVILKHTICRPHCYSNLVRGLEFDKSSLQF